MTNLGLRELISPLSTDEFFARKWPHEACWDAHNPDRSRAIRDIPELSSVETVLSQPARFGIFLGGGEVAMTTDPKDALDAYASGKTCFVHGDHIPSLASIRDNIAQDLGLPADAMRCEVFCSPASSGAQMHSDYDINFALLIHGTKRWRIAPNEHISNPVAQSFASQGEDAGGLTARLATKLPLPDTMPDDARTIEVKDGGLIFVPRGWWHETETEGECLQVNFAVKGPMLLTVITRAIRQLLLDDARWRDYALDLFATDHRKPAAEGRIVGLLADLIHRLQAIEDLPEASAAQRLITLAGLVPAERS